MSLGQLSFGSGRLRRKDIAFSPGAAAPTPSCRRARRQLRSLVSDRPRFTGGPGLTGGAERQEVIFVSGPLARATVDERTAPRIFGYLLSLQVWPVPASNPRWPGDQRLQPLLCRRIDPDIQFVDIKNAAKAFDCLMRDLLLSGTELPQSRGCDKADQQSKDRQNDQQFEQREATLPPRKCTAEFV